jgi:hypothetical protein
VSQPTPPCIVKLALVELLWGLKQAANWFKAP